jgi:hypothetical protein
MRVARSHNRTGPGYDSPPAKAVTDAGRRLRRIRQSSATSLTLRVRVYATRGKLDRQIAASRAHAPSAALELRIRQLTDARAQRRTADSLRRVVKHVDRLGNRIDYSPVPLHRAAVRTAREAILGLADRLDTAAPVNARGMVLARELVTDGATSPLYDGGCGRTITEAIWDIAHALGPEETMDEFDPVAC